MTRITKEEIATSYSRQTLREWHALYCDEHDQMVSQIDAAKLVGTYSPDRFSSMESALAAVNIVMKRIEKRMAEIGGELILTRQKARAEAFRKQDESIRRLKAENAELRAMLGMDQKEAA